MKNLIFAISFIFLYYSCSERSKLNQINKKIEWSPVGNRIKTKWASKITPDNVWHNYPRPQMVRSTWRNLNGLWDYAILNRIPRERLVPITYKKQILVPFSIESSLSGVGKELLPVEVLWYRTKFDVSDWKEKEILIHFGAVDYKSTLYINGK